MSKIKYIIIDVDGTMTDGGIYYDNYGNEWKKFNTKDAAGIFAARQLGIKIMVLTGRECAATLKRMTELKVDHICQNIKNKVDYLKEFIIENKISGNEILYIGDDLNDYSPMQLCGIRACPANSCKEIREIADYVSELNGGEGAVREIIEHILRKEGEWEKAVVDVYGIGL